MHFPTPLIPGILIQRYKRFLADVRLEDGSVVTAHCPNSGSMKGCADPGWRVLLSESPNPNRRLKYTWELVHNGRCWIGINTQWPNHLAAEAIRAGVIPELTGYRELRMEVPYGSRRSRIDILLEQGPAPTANCYVEVKNTTLIGADGAYCFPDAVTERGRKHLLELTDMVKAGHRAVMLYVIQRSDGHGFRPAWEIDPEYGKAWLKAIRGGVEVLAWQADLSPASIQLARPVVVNLAKPRPARQLP